MKIWFVHPDLGIGGAERLIVDAACGLVKRGHDVTIFTSHHDPTHCFEETKDGTLKVFVLGNTIFPTSLFGNRFRALCAYLRNLHLAAILKSRNDECDIIISDQISASIPILKLISSKILFYCHFPDKLLTKRESLSKLIYRWPVDKLEEWTTNLADIVVVNSKFTRSVFKEAFSSIQFEPQVLYPGIQVEKYQKNSQSTKEDNLTTCLSNSEVILSINRFERKKALSLAIYSFAELVKDLRFKTRTLKLIVAGGYDSECLENKEHLIELGTLAIELGFETYTIWDSSPISATAQIIFLPSFSQNQRTYLLEIAQCLLYTPSYEHFGIVPVEAMYSQVLVIAVNNGGPCETIVDGETGYLVEPNPQAMSQAIGQILMDSSLRQNLAKQGKDRVLKNFTSDIFDESLEKSLTGLNSKPIINSFSCLCTGWIFYLPFYLLDIAKGNPFLIMVIALLSGIWYTFF